jgi:DNA-binding NtrC family response regulator
VKTERYKPGDFPNPLPDNKLSGKYAVIIDDETDICFLLSSILKQKSIHSVIAGSLYEAEKVLKKNPDPQYIFIDNNLPDGSGLGYITRLRKNNPSSIIIMITAHDSIGNKEKARVRGANDFIGKPFSKELIFNTIEKLRAKH